MSSKKEFLMCFKALALTWFPKKVKYKGILIRPNENEFK